MRIILILILNLFGFLSYSQFNIDQFYKSDFLPEELNMNSKERLTKIHNDYLKVYNLQEKELDAFAIRNNYYLEKLNRSGQLFYGDEISQYLNSLKDFILQNDEKRDFIHVYLVNLPQINAFTNDFGNIYINIGTIAKLETEEQLLTVLAHEIAHIKLRHTLKTEQYIDSLQTKLNANQFEELETHLFNQEQELQADSLAYQLLNNLNINLYGTSDLFEKLQFNHNPIYDSNVDLFYLTSNVFVLNKLNQRYQEYLKSTYQFAYRSDPDIQDSISKPATKSKPANGSKPKNTSTHPTIEDRIAYFRKFNYTTDTLITTRPQEDFHQKKKLAEYLYTNSLMTNGLYTDGLFHTLKLLELYPQDSFLLKSKLKFLILLTQEKYRPEIANQVINIHANECNSHAFHAFRKFILSITPTEMNILSCITSEETPKNSDPYLEEIQSIAYQFLYKNNPKLFAINNSNELSFPDTSTLVYLNNIQWNPELTLLKAEKEVIKELQKEGGQIIKTQIPLDSIYLNYFTNLYSSKENITILKKSIELYKEKRFRYEQTLTVDHLPVTFNPIYAKEYYKRSSFHNRMKVDTNSKIAFIENISIYLQALNEQVIAVDLEESLNLEQLYNDAVEKNQLYDFNFSASINDEKKSVASNYRHYCFLTWLGEAFTFEDLNFSTVDEEIWNFRKNNSIDYLVFNVNVTVKNRGTGNKYYSLFDDIYLDMTTGGIVYVSQFITSHKPKKKSMELIQYTSGKQVAF